MKVIRHTEEEKKWIESLVAKELETGVKVGRKQFPSLAAEYLEKFKKPLSLTGIGCWLWRVRGNKSTESKSEHRGGWKFKHTEEEVIWAQGAVSRIRTANRKIGGKAIKELGLIKEYHRQFKKKLSVSGMYYWFKHLPGTVLPMSPMKTRKKKNLMGQLMDEITKYLLVVDGIPLAFDSEESLKEAIENPEVGHKIGSVRLFTATPINIDRRVTVSIGK